MQQVLRASGSVRERPLPRLLVALAGRAVTGRVDVAEEEGPRSTVYLRRGLPVHVERPDSADRLDHVLVETGILPPLKVAEAVKHQMQTGRLLGEVIYDLGLAPAEAIRQALRLQLRRKLTRLFSPETATFEVLGTEHRFGADADAPGVALEARSLVYPGIRAAYDDARLARELLPLMGREARLHRVPPAALRDVGFLPTDQPLLELLAGPGVQLEESWLRIAAGPRTRDAKAVLLALYYLDLLELRAGPPAPTGVTPPPVMLTPPPTPARNSAAARISAEWARLTPPQLLTLAERFFRNGDQGLAEAAFQVIAGAEPTNLRCRAYLAWMRFWKPNADRPALLQETLRVFQEALRHDPLFAYGHHFIGELHKLRNDVMRAEQSFRQAVGCDPTLLEAQRELRLIAMRRGRPAGRA